MLQDPQFEKCLSLATLTRLQPLGDRHPPAGLVCEGPERIVLIRPEITLSRRVIVPFVSVAIRAPKQKILPIRFEFLVERLWNQMLHMQVSRSLAITAILTNPLDQRDFLLFCMGQRTGGGHLLRLAKGRDILNARCFRSQLYGRRAPQL